MPQLTAEERKRISETRARDLIAQGRGSELSLFQQEKYGVIPSDVRMEQTKLRNIGRIPETQRSPQQAIGYAQADVGQYSRPTSFGQHLRNALSQAMGMAGGEQLKKQRAELRAQLFAAPQTIGAELTPFQLEYFSPAEQRRLEALRMGGLSGQLENIDTALQERGATLEGLLGTGLGLYGEQQQAAERRLQALLGAQEKKAQAEQDLQNQYRQFLATQRQALDPTTGEILPFKEAPRGGGSLPSAIKTFQFYQGLSPEDRETFMESQGRELEGDANQQDVISTLQFGVNSGDIGSREDAEDMIREAGFNPEDEVFSSILDQLFSGEGGGFWDFVNYISGALGTNPII